MSYTTDKNGKELKVGQKVRVAMSIHGNTVNGTVTEVHVGHSYFTDDKGIPCIRPNNDFEIIE